MTTCQCDEDDEPTCETDNASDGAECDFDTNDCTTGDSCLAGECIKAPPLPLDDENPCTEDQCVKGEIVHTALLTGQCDDGNECTTGDACVMGNCTGGEPSACVVGTCISDAECVQGVGCVETAMPVGAACDDGSLCTAQAACTESQTCEATTYKNCGDGNPCTADSCEPADGSCVHDASPLLEGLACAPETNHCEAEGACVSGICLSLGEQDCDDGNPCTHDVCDTEGGCVYTAVDGSCQDGNSCTLNDICLDGVCAPGNWSQEDACNPPPPCVNGDAVVTCLQSNAFDDGSCCCWADDPTNTYVSAHVLDLVEVNAGDAIECCLQSGFSDGCEDTAHFDVSKDGVEWTQLVEMPIVSAKDDSGAWVHHCVTLEPTETIRYVRGGDDNCYVDFFSCTMPCEAGYDCDNLDCSDGNPCTEDLCDAALGCLYDTEDLDGESCAADPDDPCLLGSECVAGVCTLNAIEACLDGDGCCASGCIAVDDSDCPDHCGNGLVDSGETCDGVCPYDCFASDACDSAALVGAPETCNAKCVFTPVMACISDDGCCPDACDAAADNDCENPPSCTIDIQVQCIEGTSYGSTFHVSVDAPHGHLYYTYTYTPGEEPLYLPNWCLNDTGTPFPVNATSGCISATYENGTCLFPEETGPQSCEETFCYDCGTHCGNGELDAGELCDGDCPHDCVPPDTCSLGTFSGSPDTCDSVCTITPIEACADGDGCCADGCVVANDSDCVPTCGNGIVEDGETCDDSNTANGDGCDSTCTNECVELPDGTCCPPEGFCPLSDTTISGQHVFDVIYIPAGVTVTCEGNAPLLLDSSGPVWIDGVLSLAGAHGAQPYSGTTPGACGGYGGGDGSRASAYGQTTFINASGPGECVSDEISDDWCMDYIHPKDEYEGSPCAFLAKAPGAPGDGPGGGWGGQMARPLMEGKPGGTGGGGGGSFITSGSQGGDSSNNCGLVYGGAPGPIYEATLQGGSGGGGGGHARNGECDECSGGSTGAGGNGGAGGGVLKLTVDDTVSITGLITARGGEGGPASGAVCNGGGGGGAGGLIEVTATGFEMSETVEAHFDVSGGNGGPPLCSPGGYGGGGGEGLLIIP